MSDFVDFKLAKKLKGKGFKEDCLAHFAFEDDITYNINSDIIGRRLLYCCNDYASIWANGLIDAPTISQVLKWLREEKDIHISTMPYINEDYELKWLYNVIIIKVSNVCTFTEKQGRDFTSSDEAALAGIEYTLYHFNLKGGNKMKTLAIRGHVTRGGEVIEILEMLGGVNYYEEKTDNESFVFYVSDDKRIRALGFEHLLKTDATVFTLEKFLEKYPYKVRDKVLYKDTCKWDVHWIKSAEWVNDEVRYGIDFGDGFTLTNIKVTDLKPYNKQKEEKKKEENKEVLVGLVPTSKGHEIMPKKGYEIKQDGEKFYVVKKQPQYPKTYEECCEMLGISREGSVVFCGDWVYGGDYLEQHHQNLRSLSKLLICRDAYWKLADGWKPEWENTEQDKYVIECVKNEIVVNGYPWNETNHILSFPTSELRDTFYENFKDLIDECKELL